MTRFASFNLCAIFCIPYCDDLEANSFRARIQLHTASTISHMENSVLSTPGIYIFLFVREFSGCFFLLLLPAVPLLPYKAQAFQAFQAACRGHRWPQNCARLIRLGLRFRRFFIKSHSVPFLQKCACAMHVRMSVCVCVCVCLCT